jgi:hypothetical protein
MTPVTLGPARTGFLGTVPIRLGLLTTYFASTSDPLGPDWQMQFIVELGS